MSKYVKGIKRNQIIQRWLQGIEDQDYEVFPTKKDGKYIVKLRENKAPVKSGAEPIGEANNIAENNDTDNDNNNNNNNDNDESDDATLRPTVDTELKPKDATLSPTGNVELSRRRIAGAQRIATSPSKMKSHCAREIQAPVNNDSTINLEILEQLRSLGEEIRNDRFKKEQKQYIKHVVNKELNKSRIRSKYVPDIFVDADEEDADASKELKPTTQSNLATNNINNKSEQADLLRSEDAKLRPTVEQIEIEQPKFRSRIRR